MYKFLSLVRKSVMFIDNVLKDSILDQLVGHSMETSIGVPYEDINAGLIDRDGFKVLVCSTLLTVKLGIRAGFVIRNPVVGVAGNEFFVTLKGKRSITTTITRQFRNDFLFVPIDHSHYTVGEYNEYSRLIKDFL